MANGGNMETRSKKYKIRLSGFLILISLLLSLSWQNAAGQEEQPQRPIDMMVVIDDTCSNFPMSEVAAGCSVFGSDPDFLRIRGVNLLLSRLGLGQPDEEEYQIGIISFGDDPILVSDLTSVFMVRDSLAEEIERPTPHEETRILDALMEAYRRLLSSQAQNPDHVPAIVLISDGFPVPRESQSLEEIERVVASNSDVQHFIILLNNADIFPDDFVTYVEFWQQMQLDYNHVFVYPLEDNTKIIDTYYEIISRLEDITPTNPITLQSGLELEVYIGQFVERMVLTAFQPAGQPEGIIEIIDPQGNQVQSFEAGVSSFKGEFNPVEVISIGPPRLTEELKDQYWTIVSSEEIETYFDRQGAYSIEFIEPVVKPPEIKNNFSAVDSHNSYTDILIELALVQQDGTPLTDAQPFRGEVIFSDGSERAIRTPYLIEPNAEGVYQFEIDLEKDFPEVYGSEGFLSMVIEAGNANPVGIDPIPIASARLFLELVPGPTIQSIFPSTIKCYPEQPNNFSVRIDHYETLDPDSVTAIVYSDNDEVALEHTTGGEFSGNLAPLCDQLIQELACSTQGESNFYLEINGQYLDDTQQISINRVLPVEINSIPCTPTPIPPTITVVPTQTPTPTAIPDSDGDGLLDTEDNCKNEPGYEYFQGCPPPNFIPIIGGIVVIGLGIILILIIMAIRRYRQSLNPPNGYVMACRLTNVVLEPTSIYETGKQHRTHQVTIGGDRNKAHLFVRNLRPVEFFVEERKGQVYIINADTEKIVDTFSSLSARMVKTSNPDIVLWIGLSRKTIQDVQCGE
jgi:hypothetical protein